MDTEEHTFEPRDILGRACVYFPTQFASAKEKKDRALRVIRVMVEMLAPYRGSMYQWAQC